MRALARSDAAAGKVRDRGAEPVAGDLDDEAALRAGAEGAEVAFHAAAKVEDWGDPAEFERLNVRGTENVIAACRAAGVRRLVHVGTEAALMAGSPLVNVDESAPLRPDSPVLVLVQQGQGRAARARRQRRRTGDRRDPAALRLGPRRHDAAAGAGRAGAVGALPLGRRRPPPDGHDPRRQHRRGPLARRHQGARRRRLLRHRRRARAVPRVRLADAPDPGRDAARLVRPGGRRPGGRRRGGAQLAAAAAARARRRSPASRSGSRHRSARSTSAGPSASSATGR